jgi:tripartite-type tricarboxylate transporter receptor subunit TctC
VPTPLARAAWLALALAAATGSATAQPTAAYPSKTVRLVVPYPPGGSNDVLSRVVAQALTTSLGQPFVVDNRAGAGGMIGAEHVARSEPDGYTLLNVQASFATNAAIRAKMPYDTARDFTYLGMMAIGPMLVAVHPSMPAKTVRELVELLKKRPGALNYGSTGIGGINHLATELFRKMAGIDIVHVPYKGVAPALADLVGGHVQLVITSFPSAYTQVQAGRLRALAIASARRSAFAPAVPTVSESGVPGYIVDLWWGLAVPARTPSAIVERLAADLTRALQSEDVRQRFAREGAEPTVMARQAFATFVAREITRWRDVARDANIKPE